MPIYTNPVDPQALATLRGAIQAARSILCISHVKPDGDAIGSLLGMGWLLREVGQAPTLALQDEVPAEHQALPGADAILTANSAAYAEQVVNRRFDLVICLDASSPDRMGNAYNPALHGSAPLLVIDHHITNTYFGDFNWVAPECAATCQMVVYLADALGIPLAGALAECLLTGLVTDTLCFRTSNTDAAVLETAMRLMRGGANLAQITQRTVNRQPFSLIKLWSLILPTVQLEDGVIWATADQALFALAGAPPSDIGLASFLVTADEAHMSAVLVERPDETGQPAVECSFRAKPGFDVAQLAFSFGGGGHPPASGCTIPGALAEVTAQVIPAMKAAHRAQLEQLAKVAHGAG
jgi:phosphoesterase RecJ-like protein